MAADKQDIGCYTAAMVFGVGCFVGVLLMSLGSVIREWSSGYPDVTVSIRFDQYAKKPTFDRKGDDRIRINAVYNDWAEYEKAKKALLGVEKEAK